MNNVQYATSEHYFQAQKFVGTKVEETVKQAASPAEAASLGRNRSFPLRRDWEQVKDSIMEQVVYAKFTQHKNLTALLLSTGAATLIEHTTNDSYWADGGDGSGKNMLGIILMKLRQRIREEQQQKGTNNTHSNNNNNSKAETSISADLAKGGPQNLSLKNLKPQQFDYFLILDFEAQCEKNQRIRPQEIIEFPTVLLNAKTLQIESEFHMYVKPTARPKLTQFCIELTGIQQSWVDEGQELPAVLSLYDKWLQDRELPSKSFAFVTCGDWDLATCLPNQSQDQNIQKPKYFDQWINIKKSFANEHKTRLLDMVGMLDALQIPLTGRHHSGIDDCRNITKIVQRMLSDGVVLKLNGHL